jgi:hypothetical protein
MQLQLVGIPDIVGYLRISYSAVTISRDSRNSRVPADQLQCSYN